MNIININKFKVKINKEYDETDRSLKIRLYFIKKASPKKSDLAEVVRLSYIYRNMRLLKCRYPNKLESLVKQYVKI